MLSFLICKIQIYNFWKVPPSNTRVCVNCGGKHTS